MKLVQGWVVCAVAAIAVAGCASGVTRDAEYGAAAAALAVNGVSISLSPAAQKLAADNPKFNPEQLAATVQKALESKGLIARDGPRAEIVVTEFRVKGTFSAVMFGALAGTDNVTGDVVVRDASGRQVRKFAVNATYGLGGFAGGQDDMRLGWLYDKFAEHTVAELSGRRKD